MWLKVKAGIAIAFAAMLYYIKYLSSKNARLEHNEKIREKVEKIKQNQEEFEKEVLESEDKRIEESIKANSGKSRRDRASRL